VKTPLNTTDPIIFPLIFNFALKKARVVLKSKKDSGALKRSTIAIVPIIPYFRHEATVQYWHMYVTFYF
jgi:uncharacterized membrane protein (GlpM family)